MRLSRLFVKNFKNLRDVEIKFDSATFSTVIVGRNGSGKSNVLEALVLIFRGLDLQEPVPFPYELEYECRGHLVRIEALDNKATYHVKPNGSDEWGLLSKKAFHDPSVRGFRPYLPAHVFGYYSGPSNRFEEHFNKHHELFYRALLEGLQAAHIRPLFYARTIHSQFVLLAFFSGLGDSQEEFLRNYLGIQGLDSVLFVLREPDWGKAAKYRNFEWFWKARGVVRKFLDSAYQNALAPLRLPKQRVSVNLAKSTSRDQMYLYLPDVEALRTVASQYQSQQEFFAALESTYISDLISEVRVRVRIGTDNQALSFRELSEGEQQLLMVLGLLKFTLQEESLFLLDEPDTHLNPAWSVEYLELLHRVVGDSRRSHFIITTHDPLVLAGLQREQVQILARDNLGKIYARIPDEDPRGMGVGALLTSDIYGLRSELDLYTLEKIERKRLISMLERKLTSLERAELSEINDFLATAGFIKSQPDPAYESWATLRTMLTQQLGVQGAAMTPQQQEKLASAIHEAQGLVLDKMEE